MGRDPLLRVVAATSTPTMPPPYMCGDGGTRCARHPRIMKMAILGLLAAVALAACGNDDDVEASAAAVKDDKTEEERPRGLTKAEKALKNTESVALEVTTLPKAGDREKLTKVIVDKETLRWLKWLRTTPEAADSAAACPDDPTLPWTGQMATLRFLDKDEKEIANATLVCGTGVLNLPSQATTGVFSHVDLRPIVRTGSIAR
jgi:hypothetical protein